MLVIASSQGGKKKGGGALSVEDFLPAWVRSEIKKEKDPEKSEKSLQSALFGMAVKSGTVKNNG